MPQSDALGGFVMFQTDRLSKARLLSTFGDADSNLFNGVRLSAFQTKTLYGGDLVSSYE